MADLGRFGRIVLGAAKNPKVKSALQSPKARQLGGRAVDGAAGLVEKAARGKHQDKIRRARDEAHKRLGDGRQGR